MTKNILNKALERKREEIEEEIRKETVSFLDGDTTKKERIINALNRYEGIINTLKKEVL